MADRPIHIDLGEESKHGIQQHPASGSVTGGRAKPPQSSVLYQALTLASDTQPWQDQKTSLLVKTFVTTQLLRKVGQLH